MAILLTVEEQTILKMYSEQNKSRDETIKEIREALIFVKEPEIEKIMQSLVRKINAMGNQEFNQLDLSDALEME